VRVLREHFPAHDFQVLAANSRRPQLRWRRRQGRAIPRRRTHLAVGSLTRR
jgi:hypothetical protein